MDCNNCFFSDDSGACLIDGCSSDRSYSVTDDDLILAADSAYDEFLDAILNE